MDKLVKLVSSATDPGSKNNDDFADRLSSRYSVILLVTFAVLVGLTQYVRNPMTCWAPVHFTKCHTTFSNNYCWVHNTYYLPWDDFKRKPDNEKTQTILYYQWIPFILLAQAVGFYFPSVIWHGMNNRAGVDADDILSASHTMSGSVKAESRERALRLVTKQMHRFVTNRVDPKANATDLRHLRSCTWWQQCGRRVGFYLMLLFIVSKLFFLGNLILQFYLLSKVLKINYQLYGFYNILNPVSAYDWHMADQMAFPRVTLCDLTIRGQDLGNVHPYTVQCVLPVNIYNEKIYQFLWFWMVFVGLVSIVNFIIWILRTVFSCERNRFIQNHLARGNRMDDALKSMADDEVTAFAGKYLKMDGVFLLRLISQNTDTITTTEITCSLYDTWRNELEEQAAEAQTMNARMEGNGRIGEDAKLLDNKEKELD